MSKVIDLETRRMLVSGEIYIPTYGEEGKLSLTSVLRPSYLDENADAEGNVYLGSFLVPHSGVVLKVTLPIERIEEKFQKMMDLKWNNAKLVSIYQEIREAIEPILQEAK